MITKHTLQRANFIVTLVLNEDTGNFGVACSSPDPIDSTELQRDLQNWARQIVRDWAQRTKIQIK